MWWGILIISDANFIKCAIKKTNSMDQNQTLKSATLFLCKNEAVCKSSGIIFFFRVKVVEFFVLILM